MFNFFLFSSGAAPALSRGFVGHENLKLQNKIEQDKTIGQSREHMNLLLADISRDLNNLLAARVTSRTNNEMKSSMNNNMKRVMSEYLSHLRKTEKKTHIEELLRIDRAKESMKSAMPKILKLRLDIAKLLYSRIQLSSAKVHVQYGMCTYVNQPFPDASYVRT